MGLTKWIRKKSRNYILNKLVQRYCRLREDARYVARSYNPYLPLEYRVKFLLRAEYFNKRANLLNNLKNRIK